MLKRICSYIVIVFSFLLLVSPVFAADFSLLQIGALSTNGANYPEWWYTGINPVFSGTAAENAEISVSINGESSQTTADGAGSWSYASGLAAGDHAVSFSSNGETIAFTLHTGQALPSDVGSTTTSPETSESTVPVPDTGSSQILLYIISISLISFGIYLSKYKKPALVTFEDKVRRDLD